MTLFTLVVFLLGIWSLMFYASRMLREDMERQLGNQLFSTVSLVALQVNEDIKNRFNALQLVANSITPALLENRASLQALLEQRPVLGLLFNGGTLASGIDGTTIADVPLSAGRVGFNYMDRENIAAALREGKSSIGRAVKGKKLAAPVFSMAVPIHDPKGKVIGALVGVTDLSKPSFLDKITESKYGKTGGYVLIAPQHGLTVTATDKNLILRPNPAPGINPLFDRYVQGFEGFGSTVDSRGFRVFSAAKQIPIAGWLLVGRLSAEEAFAPIGAMQQRILLAAFVFTLIAGSLTGWITLRMLRRQLSPMIAATKELTTLSETNRPPQPLPITSQDEIGELIGGFNRVLGTLAQRENALTESEARFRQMFENNTSVLLLIEPDSGSIVEANTAAARFYGYSVDRMRAMSIDQINALTPAQVAAERNRAVHEERNVFIFPHRLASGEVRTVEVHSSPVSVSGRTLLFSIISDLSERKRLEQEREQYFRFFQLSIDPMCIADPFGCFKQVNPAFTQLTGYSDSELVAKPFLDFVLPEDRQRTAEEMKLQVSVRSSLQFENRYVCKDGKVILLSWTAYFDKKDGVTYATARDITELRRAEDRLERFFALVPDLMCIASTDGYFLRFNSAWHEMLGYTEQEIRSTPFIEFVHPDDRRATIEAREQQDAGEPILSFVNRYRCKDGRYRWLDWRTTPVIDGQFIFATARDITERNRAEAEHAKLEARLHESQKMEALGTLAGGVAHDFNNVIAMILGNVELARQDVGPGHSALVSLDEIDKASRRAKDLVQQILAFGRRQKVDRKPTSLSLVVLESARLLRASIPAKVSLNVDCRADTPPVLADATQINQILLNLCSNALQAMQDQKRPGIIEVRLEAHTQGQARGDLRPGRYTCLTVRDNGPGMDEATRARIFEPFFTTKPAGKGTGLGLSVVHGIVRAHEASIEVQSKPGEGSEFRIYFPAIEGSVPADTTATPSTAPVHGKGKHVLYVDDEEGLVFLVKRLLERQGFRVSGYSDPHEALAAARADPGQFDLAVTDYNMPGMSGLEVASELKTIRADLPVVLASGYITEEVRAKALAAGVRELIYKPNTVDDLCEAVARYANAQSGTEGTS